jgi:hypothetical protein
MEANNSFASYGEIRELNFDEIEQVGGSGLLSRAVTGALIVAGVGTGVALVAGIAVGIAVVYLESK